MTEWHHSIDASIELIRVASDSDVRGCSQDDIDRLEGSSGVQLPDAYRRFLRGIGQAAGDFMSGSDFCLGFLERIQRGAREMAGDSGCAVPQTYFVFFSHQGYEYLLLDTESGANPSVYYLGEGAVELRALEQTFAEWFSSTVREEFGRAGES